MLPLVFCSLAWAAENTPTVDVVVSWRPRTARVFFDAPPGHHVAPDAPLRATLDVAGLPWSVDTMGAAARGGLAVPLPSHRPALLEGTVELSVCDDAGSTCTVVTRSLQGLLDLPKGAGLRLDARAPADRAHPEAADLDAVLAALDGDLALIDFGAVWCPPCNRMAAEVLHDPADAALLEGMVLVEVDVDDHANWAIKDRYAVGGYPTLVAVDKTGAEVDRRVGYESEAALHAWLSDLPTMQPLSSPPEPGSLTPDEAGAWALRLVQAQKEGHAGPFLAVAGAAAVPVPSAQLATYLLMPTPEGALELAGRGVPVTQWGWDALDFAPDHAKVAAAVGQGARTALETADPVEAAELFYMLGVLADEDAAPDLFRAGAVSLTAALSGNLELDRGHLGFLSRLWEKAGAVDQAAAVLAPALARWPTDMTFHESRAALALRAEDYETAVQHASLAVEYGHGDNRLRTTALLGRALVAAGRNAEAATLVAQTLAETSAPADGLNVRTPRYLKALRELGAEIAAEAAGAKAAAQD